MGPYRKLIVTAIPVTGTIIVFLGVLLIPDFNMQARLAVVLVGVLMIEAGVWNLPNRMLPSDRKYTKLREEVDDFIVLVRSLNGAAIARDEGGDPGATDRFNDIREDMRASVERMAELAGREAPVPSGAPGAPSP